jgi:hypothetical protein
MSFAEKISLLFSGLFLLVGMLTGVWKYTKIMSSDERRAPVYVDIAHRNALLFSFACVVLAKLVEYSPFGSTVKTSIVGVPLFYFVMTNIGQIKEGFLNRTDNIFNERNFVTTWFIYGLIIGEVGSIAVLLGGFVYSQFL